MKLPESVTISDLPEALKTLAEIAGMPVIRRLINEHSGIKIQIPARHTNFFIKKYVSEHFDGDKPATSVRIISRELGVSERTIWKTLNQKTSLVTGSTH
jgi:hypothetical protein